VGKEVGDALRRMVFETPLETIPLNIIADDYYNEVALAA